MKTGTSTVLLTASSLCPDPLRRQDIQEAQSRARVHSFHCSKAVVCISLILRWYKRQSSRVKETPST